MMETGMRGRMGEKRGNVAEGVPLSDAFQEFEWMDGWMDGTA